MKSVIFSFPVEPHYSSTCDAKPVIMSKQGHHTRNSSASIGGYSAGDAKREINQILGKNARSKNNDNNLSTSSTKQSLSQRKQKLETKRKKLRSKSGINAEKYNSKSNNSNNSNDKIVREQQKISTEWMKISKEKDLLDKEKITLKKEKVKLTKEKNEMQKQIKSLTEERKNMQILHKKWKQESNNLLKKIEEKYSSFNNMKSKGKGNKLLNEEYIKQRRVSLENHVSNLDEIANELPTTKAIETSSNDNNNLSVEMPRSDTKRKRSRSRSRSNANNDESGDIAEERVKLQRQQQAAKVCTECTLCRLSLSLHIICDLWVIINQRSVVMIHCKII